MGQKLEPEHRWTLDRPLAEMTHQELRDALDAEADLLGPTAMLIAEEMDRRKRH